MYIKLTQNCDRCIVLKTVSSSIVAYDEKSNLIKGARKNSTVKIAEFSHEQKIEHCEIPPEDAERFKNWREEQIRRIHIALLGNASEGMHGGIPQAKTKSTMGKSEIKIGEFSGVILGGILINPGTHLTPELDLDREGLENVLIATNKVKSDLLNICKRILYTIQTSGKKYCSAEDAREMLVAHSALGCALDSRGIGYVIKKDDSAQIPSPADQGTTLFNKIKKEVQLIR